VGRIRRVVVGGRVRSRLLMRSAEPVPRHVERRAALRDEVPRAHGESARAESLTR